jgi:hypothetical protein
VKLAYAITGRARPEVLRFLRAWADCEGGRASYNPLNTTWPALGATKYNDAGVRNYTDELQGVAATLLTLRLPYYMRLLAALRSPTTTADEIVRASERDLHTWGTGSACIKRLLQGSRGPA